MAILLRRDPDTGYTYVDFFTDPMQWRDTATLHELDESSPVEDISGWTARITVRSTRGVVVLVIEDIVIDGLAGALTWDEDLSGLTEPVYDYALVLDPDDDRPVQKFQGRLIRRALVDAGPSST